MRQNDSTVIKNAEHSTAALCLCVLALSVGSTLIINFAFPKFDSAAAFVAVSAAAFLLPSAVFLLFNKNGRGAFISSPQKHTFKFCISALFLLISSALLFKSIIYYISGSATQGNASVLSGLGYFESLFCYAVLPAILEEFLFRGVAFCAYEKSCGGIGAIIATSLFFAASHFSAAEFIPYFVSGMILGTVVYICRSVFPAVILHFINNFFSYYLENAVFKITSETKSGVLAVFILSAISLLLLFCFLLELEHICRMRYVACPSDENSDEFDGQADVCPRLLPLYENTGTVLCRIFASPFVWVSAVLFITITTLF